MWRLEAPQQGSQLVPSETRRLPTWFMSMCPPTPQPVAHFSSPNRALPSTLRVDISGQESKLLCSV